MIPKLTAAGKNLLLRALAGETINFTKIQIGNGNAQDPTQATALSNPVLTVQLSKITVGDEYVTLTATFTNGTVASGFHITEAGFYAEDPDNAGSELLYAIGNEDNSTADYVPSNTNRILEMQIDALIFIGDAENVTAAISGSLVYATAAELKAHTDDKVNPHGVTKSQVGLGSVPNVETNDQTPTYADAAALATLSSGEKVSTAFGKIKLAITNLINHINNKSNPHSVTASQVGAATISHTHNAIDINSGVLPALRGGTGISGQENLISFINSASTYIGNYTGYGKSGPSYKNSISIPLGRTPKALFVIPGNAAAVSDCQILIALRGVSSALPIGGDQLLKIIWAANSVTWYTSADNYYDGSKQLNNLGSSYQYLFLY